MRKSKETPHMRFQLTALVTPLALPLVLLYMTP
jgi:hypothetical protein